MGFFEWLNRWQVVVAAAVIVTVLNFGLYLGFQHPGQLDASLVANLFEGRGSEAPAEDAAPRGGSKEPQRSTPSPSESQYGP